MKSFSVLASIYKKENPEYLIQALNSIFNQTATPTEVILVEDGPLNTELYRVLDDFEKKFPQFKRVKLEVNSGLGKALNEGLKYCSYELVARMDTDDIALSTRFEKQLAVFDKYPEVDIVSAWIDEFINSPENIVSTRKLPEFPFEIYEYGKKRCPINHPVVMFKKSAVLLAGGYRHFPLMEDYYLWVRLLLSGSKFYNIQESLLLFRTSDETYKRRGGLKHGIDEIKFQYHIHKLRYTNLVQFIKNTVIRFITRIIPNGLRKWIYEHALR
ncbi:MAG: glycosyltransferase [Paramuribaculum sp.]|nr:glycosyltransferase [Paramuribaculum sp.]